MSMIAPSISRMLIIESRFRPLNTFFPLKSADKEGFTWNLFRRRDSREIAKKIVLRWWKYLSADRKQPHTGTLHDSCVCLSMFQQLASLARSWAELNKFSPLLFSPFEAPERLQQREKTTSSFRGLLPILRILRKLVHGCADERRWGERWWITPML